MSSAAYKRAYRQRHPERCKARNAVSRAIRDGKLPRASSQLCARCGGQAAHYHHRNGYDRASWLDVEPVCVACHLIIDRDEPLAEMYISEEDMVRLSYADIPDEDRGVPGLIERLENASWRNGRIWQGEPVIRRGES